MARFEYVKISANFITALSEEVQARHTIALFGHRYGGKTFVMNALSKLLKAAGTGPLVELALFREGIPTSDSELEDLIFKGVKITVPGMSDGPRRTPGFFWPINELCEAKQSRVLLLASNVDGLPNHLARRFLEEVRTAVQAERLVAVLSGEYDFSDLVYGATSDFTCTDARYVLQGFDQPQFCTLIRRYTRLFQFRFENDADAVNHLWHITGGNNALLLRLCLTIVNTYSNVNSAETRLISINDLNTYMTQVILRGPVGGDILYRTQRLVAQDRECWPVLEQLLARPRRGNGIPASADPPGALELSGLVIREAGRQNFASPMMEDFARFYYSQRVLGDLYARGRQWNVAFDHYRLVEPDFKVRPFTGDDKTEVELVVRALCSELYAAAAKGAGELKRLFVEGCRNVLGFGEILFCSRDGNQNWQLSSSDTAIDASSLAEIMSLLPLDSSVPTVLLSLKKPWGSWGAGALLPSIRSGQCSAVLVGDFLRRIVLARQRERLLSELLTSFARAYEHTVDVSKVEMRLAVRNDNVRIINAILDAMGGEIFNVGEVLKRAATGLQRLGYKRVYLCLVDTMRQRIQDAFEVMSQDIAPIQGMTDWPLDNYAADIQPYVCYTRKTKIVPHARNEPLANPNVVQAVNLGGFAIVPILNLQGEVLGTIHVERADGLVPTEEEGEDLEDFGHQLAIAIEQSTRVNLLQTALDKIPEPVVIFDPQSRPLFANSAAEQLLKVRRGWTNPSDAAPIDIPGIREVLTLVEDALKGSRRLQHVIGIAGEPEYSARVLSDHIIDWRKQVVGAVLHIEDLNYQDKILKAFRRVAQAADTESVIRFTFEAIRSLGTLRARMYLISDEYPNRLVSKFSHGFRSEEKRQHFNEGTVCLDRDDAKWERWLSIDKEVPLVFRYDPQGKDRAVLITPQGLQYYVVTEPSCPDDLEKTPGEYWTDIPLFAARKPLGKIVLECPEDLSPAHFEMLKVLSDELAVLLAAFQERDRHFKDRETWIRAAAAKSFYMGAHQLISKLGVLDWVLTRYRLLSESATLSKDQLNALNGAFLIEKNTLVRTIERTKDMLSVPVPQLTRFDLVEHIHSALRTVQPEIPCEVITDVRPIYITADQDLLETALRELAQNSREAAKPTHPMRISVSLERMERDSEQWIRVLYRDSGRGVPVEIKKKIFEDFFFHRPGRRRFGGGLGLAFVFRVIQAHGGRIEEDGREGEGVHFIMELPVLPTITTRKAEV